VRYKFFDDDDLIGHGDAAGPLPGDWRAHSITFGLAL